MSKVFVIVATYLTIFENEKLVNDCHLVGIFEDKDRAIQAVLDSGPHEIFEYAYDAVIIESYNLNYLQPIPRDKICFEWNMVTNKYEIVDNPEWAKNTIRFI